MTIYLRQSTASQEIPLGMFLSNTDGVTPKTGLSIANTDIQIWKAGGTTIGTKNSGGATEISGGWYYATLDDTDTNTLGSMIITVNVAGALMLRLECIVLLANIYDSWFSTAIQDVNVKQISGDATAADNCELFFDGTGYAAAVPTAAAISDAVWDEALSGHTGAGSSGNAVAAILVDTSLMGTSGDGLTAIPWNSAWDAEVQSEVTDALNAYDPPTKAELDTGLDALPTAAEIKTAIEAAGGHLALILEDTGTTLPTAIADIPTVSEFEARTIAAADYVVVTDTIAGVTLCGTCTTNTDMRGTDSAALASVCTEARLAELGATNIPADIDGIKGKTVNLPASPAAVGSNMGSVSSVTSPVTVGTNNDKTGYSLSVTPPTLIEIEASTVLAKEATLTTIAGYIDTEIAAILEDTGTTIPGLIAAIDTLIDRALGLMHENFRISSPVYSVTGKMTSCTMKIYPTAGDCTDDTNVLATYTVTATYDGDDNLATYKVVKA